MVTCIYSSRYALSLVSLLSRVEVDGFRAAFVGFATLAETSRYRCLMVVVVPMLQQKRGRVYSLLDARQQLLSIVISSTHI